MSKMKEYDVKAVSIAVVTNNHLKYARAIGVKTDDPFQAASISKALSAYAALMLVEEGRLQLDTPLSSYLKERYFGDGSDGNAITLRMILSHTSGLSNDATEKDRRLYCKLGEAFHYSGAGFAYLTKVMESITGLPLDEYMERSLLLPLGMTHSKCSILRPNGEKAVSAAYSLVTTPSDLAQLFLELLNPRMVSRNLVEQMLSDSVKINEHYSWGLGVGIQHGNGDTAIWHWGNNENYCRSLAVFFPKSCTGVVIMTEGRDGDKIYKDIAHDAIGGSYYGLERSGLSTR
jgi:CubicO group peptidase (beta-lactamase class C family)